MSLKYSLFLVLFLMTFAWSEDNPQTFTGEIADSSCAYNVHSLSRSHKEMLKSKDWGNNAADCTRRCVQKFGATYVLVHDNDVYRLDQQSQVEPFAGLQVRVSGTLGGSDKKTIHVEAIESVK